MYRKRFRKKKRKPDEERALSRMVQPTDLEMIAHNMQNTIPISEVTTPLLVEPSVSYSTCANAVLNSGTSPELPPDIQQPPIESYENMHVDARKAHSAENDPTPSRTCASPKLLPHIQQQPVEKEETDKVSTNVVAREDSSVENDADSPPQHSDSPPELPSNVRPETPKEEGLTKDSPTESDPIPLHVQQQPLREENVLDEVSPVDNRYNSNPRSNHSTPGRIIS